MYTDQTWAIGSPDQVVSCPTNRCDDENLVAAMLTKKCGDFGLKGRIRVTIDGPVLFQNGTSSSTTKSDSWGSSLAAWYSESSSTSLKMNFRSSGEIVKGLNRPVNVIWPPLRN
jgi:hypothetical protein